MMRVLRSSFRSRQVRHRPHRIAVARIDDEPRTPPVEAINEAGDRPCDRERGTALINKDDANAKAAGKRATRMFWKPAFRRSGERHPTPSAAHALPRCPHERRQ